MDSEDSRNPKDAIGDRKPQLQLMPASADVLISQVLSLGASKYGAWNWRSKQPRVSVYIGALRRHVAAWFDGEDEDPESGLCHLGHAAASLAILIDALSLGNAIDDRPPPGKAAELIARFTAEPQDEIGDLIEVDEQPAESISPDSARTRDEILLIGRGWEHVMTAEEGCDTWTFPWDRRREWPKHIQRSHGTQHYWDLSEAVELQNEIDETRHPVDPDRYGRGTESPHEFLESQPRFGEHHPVPIIRELPIPPIAKPVLGPAEKQRIRTELLGIFEQLDNGLDGDGIQHIKRLAEQLK